MRPRRLHGPNLKLGKVRWSQSHLGRWHYRSKFASITGLSSNDLCVPSIITYWVMPTNKDGKDDSISITALLDLI
jgi:hypothetical protein